MSDSVRPHRWQPTRLPCPRDSPAKNTWVGCHFLLQCMKVKSEREVAQSCLTLRDPMDCSPPGSSLHEIFQARVLEWVAISFSIQPNRPSQYPIFVNYWICGVRNIFYTLVFLYIMLELSYILSIIFNFSKINTDRYKYRYIDLSSVQFNGSVASDILPPHGRQHARLLCPSPTPGACSNWCPLSRWYHPTI